MKSATFTDDPLFELERKIARRADELTRQRGTDREHALEHWREAEREIWESYLAQREPRSAALTSGHA